MQKVLLITIFISYVIGNTDDWDPNNNNLMLMQDVSDKCVDNLELNSFLPYGMGVADAVIILISSKSKYPNCMLSFNRLETENDLFLIMVIEFSNSKDIRNNCKRIETNIIIKDEIHEDVDICSQLKNDNGDVSVYYSTTNSPNVSIEIKSTSQLTTMKLTATAARMPPVNFHCNSENEITCLIGNMSLCISTELLCDKNINCGVIGSNDEDVRICQEKRYYKLWAVVGFSVLMLVIVVAFLINLFKVYVPAVPDNFFIFNVDEDNKLILASNYRAPRRSDLQDLHDFDRRPSFRLTSTPFDLTLPSTSIEEEEKEEEIASISFPSIQSEPVKDPNDVEALKADLKKSIEKEINKAIMQQYRPRFDTDFLDIMDHIDPLNTSDQDES